MAKDYLKEFMDKPLEATNALERLENITKEMYWKQIAREMFSKGNTGSFDPSISYKDNVEKEALKKIWRLSQKGNSGYFKDNKDHSPEEFKKVIQKDIVLSDVLKNLGADIDSVATKMSNQNRLSGLNENEINDLDNDFNTFKNILKFNPGTIPATIFSSLSSNLLGTEDIVDNALGTPLEIAKNVVHTPDATGKVNRAFGDTSATYGGGLEANALSNVEAYDAMPKYEDTQKDTLDKAGDFLGKFYNVGRDVIQGTADLEAEAVGIGSFNSYLNEKQKEESALPKVDRMLVKTARDLGKLQQSIRDREKQLKNYDPSFNTEAFDALQMDREKAENIEKALTSQLSEEELYSYNSMRSMGRTAEGAIEGVPRLNRALTAIKNTENARAFKEDSDKALSYDTTGTTRDKLENMRAYVGATAGRGALNNAYEATKKGIKDFEVSDIGTLAGYVAIGAPGKGALIGGGVIKGFANIGANMARASSLTAKANAIADPVGRLALSGLNFSQDAFGRHADQMDEYFRTHGDLENFSAFRSLAMGYAGAWADLYLGSTIGRGVGKIAPNLSEKFLQSSVDSFLANVAKDGVNVANWKTMFTMLPSYLTSAARGEVAGSRSISGFLKGTANILAKSALGKRVGNIAKDSVLSGTSLATENIASTLARQAGTQNGYKLEEAAEAAGSGLMTAGLFRPIARTGKFIKDTKDLALGKTSYVPSRENQKAIFEEIDNNPGKYDSEYLTAQLKEYQERKKDFDEFFENSINKSIIGNEEYLKADKEGNITVTDKAKEELHEKDLAALVKKAETISNKLKKVKQEFTTLSDEWTQGLAERIGTKLAKEGKDLDSDAVSLFNTEEESSTTIKTIQKNAHEDWTEDQLDTYTNNRGNPEKYNNLSKEFNEVLDSSGLSGIYGEAFENAQDTNGKPLTDTIVDALKDNDTAKATEELKAYKERLDNDKTNPDNEKYSKQVDKLIDGINSKYLKTKANKELDSIKEDSTIDELDKAGVLPTVEDLGLEDNQVNKQIFDEYITNKKQGDKLSRTTLSENIGNKGITDKDTAEKILRKIDNKFKKALERKKDSKKAFISAKNYKKISDTEGVKELDKTVTELNKQAEDSKVKISKYKKSQIKVGKETYAFIEEDYIDVSDDFNNNVFGIAIALASGKVENPKAVFEQYKANLQDKEEDYKEDFELIKSRDPDLAQKLGEPKNIEDLVSAIKDVSTQTDSLDAISQAKVLEESISQYTGYNSATQKAKEAVSQAKALKELTTPFKQEDYKEHPELKDVKNTYTVNQFLTGIISNIFGDTFGDFNALLKTKEVTDYLKDKTSVKLKGNKNIGNSLKECFSTFDKDEAIKEIRVFKNHLVRAKDSIGLHEREHNAIINVLTSLQALIQKYGVSLDVESTATPILPTLDAISVEKINSLRKQSVTIQNFLREFSKANVTSDELQQFSKDEGNYKTYDLNNYVTTTTIENTNEEFRELIRKLHASSIEKSFNAIRAHKTQLKFSDLSNTLPLKKALELLTDVNDQDSNNAREALLKTCEASGNVELINIIKTSHNAETFIEQLDKLELNDQINAFKDLLKQEVFVNFLGLTAVNTKAKDKDLAKNITKWSDYNSISKSSKVTLKGSTSLNGQTIEKNLKTLIDFLAPNPNGNHAFGKGNETALRVFILSAIQGNKGTLDNADFSREIISTILQDNSTLKEEVDFYKKTSDKDYTKFTKAFKKFIEGNVLPTYQDIVDFATNELGDEKFAKQIARNFGKLAFHALVHNISKNTDKDSYAKNAIRLSMATSNRDVTIKQYNEFKTITNVQSTETGIKNYLEILHSNGINYPSVSAYLENIHNTDVKNYVEKYLNGESADFGTYIKDKADIENLAQALVDAINEGRITNTTSLTKGTVTPVKADPGNTIRSIDRMRRAKVNSAFYKDENKFRNSAPIFSFHSGFSEFKQKNADNSAVTFICDTVTKMINSGYRIKVPSYSVLRDVDTNETGSLADDVLGIMATVVLDTLPNITEGDLSPDFENQLIKDFNIKVANTFKEARLLSRDDLANQLGSLIALKLGYNRNYTSEARERYGKLALVQMMTNGYLEQVWVDKRTGKLLDKPVANNCIPAIRLTDAGIELRDTMRDINSYKDGTKTKTVTSVMLNMPNITKRPKAGEQSFKDHQAELESNFDQSLLPTDIDEEAYKKEQEAAKNLGVFDYNKWVVIDENSDIMAILTNVDSNGNATWFYMPVSASYKSDDTIISNQRLVELARKSSAGTSVLKKDILLMLGGEPGTSKDSILQKDAKGNYVLNTELTANNAPRVNDPNFLSRFPGLDYLIQYANPNTDKHPLDKFRRQGKLGDFIRTKNVENYKAIIQDLAYLVDALNSTKDDSIQFYFNEINTVNNRAFVDNRFFNYRENKVWRHIHDVNNAKDISYTTNPKGKGTKVSHDAIKFVIFGAFDLKHDKMNPEELDKSWDELVNKGGLEELVNLIVDAAQNGKLDTLDNIRTEVLDKFNTFAKDNEINFYYSEPEKNKVESKKLELDNNIPTLLALAHLADISFENTKDSSKGSITESKPDVAKEALLSILKGETKYNFSNFKLRVEVDGLTNGSAIKSTMTDSRASSDPVSRILLGAVGISSKYHTFATAITEDFLDTYLTNGAIAQANIELQTLERMFGNNFKENKGIEYLTSLYGQDSNGQILTNIASIMNRAMDKQPTMVVGYSAGKETVILNVLSYLDAKLSDVLCGYMDSVNGEPLVRNWLSKTIRLNGDNLSIEYKTATGKYEDGFLDAQGNIYVNGINQGNIFSDRSIIDNLYVSLLENANIQKFLTDEFLNPMYEGLDEGMNKFQDPYKINQEASTILADTYNAMIVSALRSLQEDFPSLSKVDRDTAKKAIVDNIANAISGIFDIGTDGTKLNTLRASVEQDLNIAIQEQFVGYDELGNEVFMTAKFNKFKKESLGAGETPMLIHSYDSNVVHMLQSLNRASNLGETFAVHDAEIAQLNQLDNNINKILFYSSFRGISSFVSRDKQLAKAINAVASNNIHGVDLSPALQNALLAQLNRMYNKATSSTNEIIYNMIGHYNEELCKADEDRLKYNQYSLGEMTAFTPKDEDLNKAIEFLTDLIGVSTNTLKNNTFEALQAIQANPHLFTVEEQALVYNKDKSVKPSIAKASTLEELIENIGRVLGNKQHRIIQAIRNYTNGKTNASFSSTLNQFLKNMKDDSYTKGTTVDNATLSPNTWGNAYNFLSEYVNYGMKLIKDTGLFKESNKILNKLLPSLQKRLDILNKANPNIMDFLTVLQDAVGTPSVKGRDLYFDNIQKYISVEPEEKNIISMKDIDKDKGIMYIYTEELDYQKLYDNLVSIANKNGTPFKESFNTWFEQYSDKIISNLKRMKEGSTVVLPLRTKADLLVIQAISKGIQSKDLNDIKIAIAPNLSDETEGTLTNSEVYGVGRFFSNYKNANFLGITAPTKSKNLDVLSIATGIPMEIEEVGKQALRSNDKIINYFAEEEPVNKGKDDEQIAVKIKNFNVTKKLTEFDLPQATKIVKLDELGYPMGVNGNIIINKDTRESAISLFDESDFLTSGYHNQNVNDYDTSTVGNMSEEELNKLKLGEDDSVRIVSTEDLLVAKPDNLNDTFNTVGTAIQINTTSSGSIVSSKVDRFLNTKEMSEVRGLLKIANSRRLKDITRAQQGEITWEEAMAPIVLTAKNWKNTGIDKDFIFNVSVDTSATIGEVKAMVVRNHPTAHQNHRVSFASLPQHFINTKYEGKHIKDSNPLNTFITKVINSKQSVDDNVRVVFPKEVLDTSGYSFISSNFNEIQTRNAAYMSEIQKNKNYKGVLILGDSDVSKDKGEVYLGNVKYAYLPLRSYIDRQVDKLAKNINNDAYYRNRHSIFDRKESYKYGQVKIKDLFNYSGYAKGTIEELTQVTDEMQSLLIDDAHSMSNAINLVERNDNENGRDNSHLAWQDKFIRNISAKIHLVVNPLWGEKGVNFKTENNDFVVKVGTGSTNASQKELFYHEINHEIINHMDRSTAKLANDFYQYILKNLKVEHFDCDPRLAKELMDRMFHHSDGVQYDNVAEAMVYLATNKHVLDAVSKLPLGEEIKTRARSILGRVYESVDGILNGNAIAIKDPSAEQLIKAIFISSYQACNRYWEANREKTPQEYQGEVYATNPGLATAFISGLRPLLDKFTYNYLGERLEIRMRYDNNAVEPMTLLGDMVRAINQGKFKFIDDFMASLEGVAKDNWKVAKLRMEGKYLIDQQRELAASAVNTAVKNIIKDVPKDVEDKLPRYLIRTDIGSLLRDTLPSDIKKLLTDSTERAKKIKELENTLSNSPYGNFYKQASKGLGQYLVTGINPTGLGYRNAYEIYAMSGSNIKLAEGLGTDLLRAIDQLATLHAVETLYNSEEKDIATRVYNALEPNVIKELCNIHNGIKDTEAEEVYNNGIQSYHVPKGELHGAKTKHKYIIAPESELKAYRWAGYDVLGEVSFDPFYKNLTKEKYYKLYAPYKSEVPVIAGVSAMTDIFKGRARAGVNINGIGRADVAVSLNRGEEFKQLRDFVTQRIVNLNSKNPKLITGNVDGNLQLNFNSSGLLVGSNFELNPTISSVKMGREYKMSAVLGDLYGSIVERANVPDFNKKVAQATIDMYEGAKKKGDYVWVSSSSEKEEYRDYYNSLPTDLKQVCYEKYGEQGIPVMKKALNSYFGYESISANKVDLEYYQKLHKGLIDYASHLFHSGPVGRAESIIRWMSKTGKENIVIKGVTTSVYNLLSNCITLGIQGLSTAEICKYQSEGLGYLRDIHSYNEQLKELKVKKIQGTYTDKDANIEHNINQSIKKMPIYPLIKAGAISNTLAEDLTETDRSLKDFIDKHVPKGTLNTLAHNAGLTPKSIIYRYMLNLANCGDSIGKMAYFKYLRSKGVPEQEAVRQSVQMFIDYSNPTPRLIQYADDLGSLPFIKFALGIQTTILNSLTYNPQRSLGYIFGSSALGLHIPDIYSSLLGISTFTDRFQAPGIGLFTDSISCLPSIKSLDAIGAI